MKIYTVMRNNILIIIIFALVLTACKDYRVEDGKLYYHSWSALDGWYTVQVEGIDINSMRILKDIYVADKNHVWYRAHLLEGAQGSSFRTVGSSYATDGIRCYYGGDEFFVADPPSLREINEMLVEDNVDVYWCRRPLHVADKASFRVLKKCFFSPALWAVDRVQVYYLDFLNTDTLATRMPIADYDSFEGLYDRFGLTGYAKDKKQVYYYEGTVLTDVDVASFRCVEFDIGQDCHRVYVKGRPTDVHDFMALREVGVLYTDKKHVYTRDMQQVPGADPKTLRSIYQCWMADAEHVYWNGQPLPDVDVKTFETIPHNDYFNGQFRESSPHYRYAKDATHVYFCDSIIANADPNTFAIVEASDSLHGWVVFDKYRIYSGGECSTVNQWRQEHSF